jgi:hypothetical protein
MSELVGEAEAGHEATLFDPVDGAEGGREEDTFDDGEGDKALGEGGSPGIAPTPCPCCFLLDRWQSVNSIKQSSLGLFVINQFVNHEGVHFVVNILNHRLETIKNSGFHTLDLLAEVGD